MNRKLLFAATLHHLRVMILPNLQWLDLGPPPLLVLVDSPSHFLFLRPRTTACLRRTSRSLKPSPESESFPRTPTLTSFPTIPRPTSAFVRPTRASKHRLADPIAARRTAYESSRSDQESFEQAIQPPSSSSPFGESFCSARLANKPPLRTTWLILATSSFVTFVLASIMDSDLTPTSPFEAHKLLVANGTSPEQVQQVS